MAERECQASGDAEVRHDCKSQDRLLRSGLELGESEEVPNAN